jgi:hypothetical protein
LTPSQLLKLFRLTALERSSRSEANAIELLESGFLLPLRLNAYTDFMSERKVRGILCVTGLTGAAAIILTGIWSALASTPTPPFIGADAFIDQNCAVCHSSPTGPGRLDLKNLSFEPANPDNFAIWVRCMTVSRPAKCHRRECPSQPPLPARSS